MSRTAFSGGKDWRGKKMEMGIGEWEMKGWERGRFDPGRKSVKTGKGYFMNNTNHIAAGVDISTALQGEPSAQICCEVTKETEKEKSSPVFLATNNTACTKGGFTSYIYIWRVKGHRQIPRKEEFFLWNWFAWSGTEDVQETKGLSVKHVECVEKWTGQWWNAAITKIVWQE